MLFCFISLCTVLLKYCPEFLEASDLMWFIHFEQPFNVSQRRSILFPLSTSKLDEKVYQCSSSVHQFSLMTSEHIGHFQPHLQDNRSLKNVSSLKNKTKQNKITTLTTNNSNNKQQRKSWGSRVWLAWRRVHQKWQDSITLVPTRRPSKSQTLYSDV